MQQVNRSGSLLYHPTCAIEEGIQLSHDALQIADQYNLFIRAGVNIASYNGDND